MHDEKYLILGLNALSRAHEMNYFLDGHRGAAIIAAYFLCREIDIEDGVADIIGTVVDEHWTKTALCAPFPDEPSEPDAIGKIIACMEQNIDGLRQVGHNVILPTLVLKAFQQLPEAITSSRVNGLCKLIESFTIIDDIQLDEEDGIPDLGISSAAAEFILTEYLSTVEAFDGRGQGWSGHLLTYGQALLDLRALGYATLAYKAEGGFKLYIKRIRMGPLETDEPRSEHPMSDLYPQQCAYWEHRKTRSPEIGHFLKYPYGFYSLMQQAKDSDLKQRCMAAAYRIF